MEYRIIVAILAIFLIALMISLVYQAFTKNYLTTIIGLVLLFTGIVLVSQEQSRTPNPSRFIPQISPYLDTAQTVRDPRVMDSQIGDEYVSIQPNRIEHQYIIIQNQQVKVGTDITHVLDNLRDVFEQVIAQAVNPVFAINEFAQDLTDQLSKYPELKSYLCVDGESDEAELVNQIMKFLLTPQVYPTQRIDPMGNLVKVEYLEDDQVSSDKCIVIYKGYRINLHQNQNNRWVFRIQKRDFSFLELKRRPRRYRKKDIAIATAKKHIREDIFKTWQNSMDLLD